MLSLNIDSQAAICSELTLPSLQQMSLTCRAFNDLINHSDRISIQIKENCFLKTDLKILNLNFILSHAKFFSNINLVELDFSRVTLAKLYQIDETSDKVIFLRKLKFIASLYLLPAAVDIKEKVDKEEKEHNMNKLFPGTQMFMFPEVKKIYDVQHPYQYLIHLADCGAIEKLSLGIEKTNSELKPLFIPLRSSEEQIYGRKMMAKNTSVKEKNPILLVEQEAAMNYTCLKVLSRPDVVSILSALWEKHKDQICHFYTASLKYVPSEVFEALCNVLITHPEKSLGTWKTLILADEQVQSLLKILTGRTIQNLGITLSQDVKPQTMQALSDLICSDSFVQKNKNSKLYFELGDSELEYKKDTAEASSQKEKGESKAIFSKMLEKFSTLNRSWGGRISNW